MADPNIQKALHGPSAFEVALGAILGIAVGALACVFYLVYKPVEKVLVLPKDPAPNMVYVITGKESNARSKGWQAKFKSLAAGGEFYLREEEMNAWAATFSEYKPADPNAPPAPPAPAKPAPKPAAKPKPGDKAKPEALEPEAETKQEFFFATSPNFSIKDSRLQIVLQCKFDYYGIGSDVWVKVLGHFTLTGDGYVFTPEEFYLGSCPLHLLPGSSPYLTGLIIGKYKIPEEIVQAWGKVSILTLEGDQMKIVVKP
jgi:hypothetical protein